MGLDVDLGIVFCVCFLYWFSELVRFVCLSLCGLGISVILKKLCRESFKG